MTTAEIGTPIGKSISLKAASERYGIPYRTLRGWIYAGKLPAFKVNGSLVRVRVADLESLFVPYLCD
jgi:excisionase family DNA binding protein